MSSRKGLLKSLPRNREKKDFFAVILFGFITICSIFVFYKSESNTSDLPRIYLICEEEIQKDDYINCKFKIMCGDFFYDTEFIDAEIKLRGNSVCNYPKKPFRVNLVKKHSLLEMRRDDDWYLFASYFDCSRLRYKLSFDLWRTLQYDNPTAILPETKYVTVYLNGDYQGFYLLGERCDKKLFDLDDAQDNINSSLIFQAKGRTFFRNYKKDKDSWEQDWPNENEDIEIMDEILTDLFDFVFHSDDYAFFNSTNNIYSKFDRDNLIDFFLFNFFILHYDFWCKNFYIVRDTYPSKFFLIPWDFDESFGQFAWERYDADENDEADIRFRSELYNRLLDNDEFKQGCRDRWSELRDELWTEDFILDMVSDMYEDIEDLLDLEYQMWGDVKENHQGYTFKDCVDYLFDWIPERLKFCDNYFSEY
ncbi:MAG: CotH kinase family protein [Promethearchaeota archaeon]